MKWILGLIISVFFLYGCSEEKSRKYFKKKDKHNAFIFNLQHYFSKNELNMSFPIWFDDSIIKLNKVKKMTRSVFLSGKSSELDKSIPKEVKTYAFNQEGELLSVKIEQYYENVKVADVSFNYLSGKDENGFATVARSERQQSIDEANDVYQVFEKEEYKEKFLVYTNEQTGDYLFYLLNRKNWGALSVDSILKPTPKDVVVLGSTFHPSKTYQVKNTVNEFNVVRYRYDKSREYIKEILYEYYPFRVKRSVLYDETGACSGFVDSTFTEKKFLKRRNSKFIFNNGIPKSLRHENYSTDSTSRFIQIEKFDYEYFD